jgi:hypothetical protein
MPQCLLPLSFVVDLRLLQCNLLLAGSCRCVQ